MRLGNMSLGKRRSQGMRIRSVVSTRYRGKYRTTYVSYMVKTYTRIYKDGVKVPDRKQQVFSIYCYWTTAD